MKEKFKLPEQAIRLWFWLFAALCLIAAVLMPDRGQMVEGMLRLCTLPYQSANSYFDASGGGFAGTIQAFVPLALLETYKNAIDAVFGAGSCHVLSVRNYGAVMVTPDM